MQRILSSILLMNKTHCGQQKVLHTLDEGYFTLNRLFGGIKINNLHRNKNLVTLDD